MSKDSKPTGEAAAAAAAAPATPTPGALNSKGLLDTEDLKRSLNYIATRGGSTDGAKASDFEILFQLKAKALGLVDGSELFAKIRNAEITKRATSGVVGLLDADGDGKLTANDFEKLWERQMAFIDARRSTIDRYLPFVGQCAFGIGCGWFVGALARRVLTNKLPIVIAGAGCYAGLQYAAQKNYINQQALEADFKAKLRELADVNKDGELNFRDLERLVEERMQIVHTKLGPGGFAPGLAGGVTFGLGLFKGLRFI